MTPEIASTTPARLHGDAATTTAAIPFRKDQAVSVSDMGGVLVGALLLLAALYGVALYAKRAGWLDRWISVQPKSGREPRRLMILERMALSRKTMVYRLQDGESQYLVVESSGAIQLSKLGERA